MRWEDDFLVYLKNLEKSKPVIFCGDLNVAHKEIDLKNPKGNRKSAGFSDEEREIFDVGCRIDYFCVSECLKEHLMDAYIYHEVYGSDHCPVGLKIF